MRKFGRRICVWAGAILNVVGTTIAYLNAGNGMMIYAGSALGAIGNISFAYVFTSYLGDVIDHVEWKTGVRSDGLTGGLTSAGMMFSVGISQGMENADFEVTSKAWLDRFDKFYADTYETYRLEQEEKVKGIREFGKILHMVTSFQHPTGIPVTEEDVAVSGCDTAIYVLARQAGEGNDRFDQQGDYRLDDVERENLEFVSKNYKNFIVVINAGGVIDVSLICGGGAKSPLWKRIFANVLNAELEVPVSEQGPGMGGAMLAMVACGEYESVKACCNKLCAVADVVKPEPDLVAKYEARYQQFKKIYPAVKALFPAIQ